MGLSKYSETEHAMSSAPLPYQFSPPPGAEIFDVCGQCGAHHYESNNFCTVCGTPMNRLHPQEQPLTNNPQHAAARGFGQLFGLHPIPAVLTLAVNAMLFGGELATMGALVPLALLVAVVLGFIVYRSQKRFYGDDDDSALIKALAVGLLTAIPTGLPAFLTVPSAVVGVVQTLRRKVS